MTASERADRGSMTEAYNDAPELPTTRAAVSAAFLKPRSMPVNTMPCSGSTAYQYRIPTSPRGLNRAVSPSRAPAPDCLLDMPGCPISSGYSFERDIGHRCAVACGDRMLVSGITDFDFAAMTISEDSVTDTRKAFATSRQRCRHPRLQWIRYRRFPREDRLVSAALSILSPVGRGH